MAAIRAAVIGLGQSGFFLDLDPVRNGNGYRLIANTGLNGVQEVPHLHFHILGGRNMGFMVARP